MGRGFYGCDLDGALEWGVLYKYKITILRTILSNMAFFLLILLGGVLVFLLYYELLWKKFERERGKGLVRMAKDFLFQNNPQAVPASSSWDDWKYRLIVELHRREQFNFEEAVRLAGVSTREVEQYLDKLEADGKVRQVGDSERGLFYRVIRA